MNVIFNDDDCPHTYPRRLAQAQFRSTTVLMPYNDSLITTTENIFHVHSELAVQCEHS